MKIKILLSIISLLAMAFLFLLPASGCGRSMNSSDNTSSPSLPLLDTETHDTVETAFFALG
jgi:hypothetical protein